jgi:predicted RNA-binding protein YlqC (UPF0109 family)
VTDPVDLLADQLEDMVRLLVDDREDVAIFLVEEDGGDDNIVFELEVAEDDVGKVIGRRGSTVRALRTLLDARAALDEAVYELEIVD